MHVCVGEGDTTKLIVHAHTHGGGYGCLMYFNDYARIHAMYRR